MGQRDGRPSDLGRVPSGGGGAMLVGGLDHRISLPWLAG